MNIKPLRDISQHEILPFFSFSGGTANKGTFVTAQSTGLNLKDEMTLDNVSWLGGTLSASFNVPWLVVPATSGIKKNKVIGMLYKDVRTVDENGFPLIFEPRKAAEMDVIVSGQASPIAVRGFVLYSGIVGNPQFGSGAAIADAGDGSLKVVDPSLANVVTGVDANTVIGKFLGPLNSDGYAPLEFNLN